MIVTTYMMKIMAMVANHQHMFVFYQTSHLMGQNKIVIMKQNILLHATWNIFQKRHYWSVIDNVYCPIAIGYLYFLRCPRLLQSYMIAV